MGADPSAASPGVPLARLAGPGTPFAPAQPTRRRGSRRFPCRGRAALRDFAAFPRPVCSAGKGRGPREMDLPPERGVAQSNPSA